jgi:cell division protein FtsQ
MNPRLKKIGRNILFLLSIPGIITAFVFANTTSTEFTLNAIHVDIENTALSFITEKDVLDMLNNRHAVVGQSLVKHLNIQELEDYVQSNDWVERAEIYISADHALHVQVKQRNPTLRVNFHEDTDFAFYLDEKAKLIPLSAQYIANVPVVTTPRMQVNESDQELRNDLVYLATILQQDSFWNAMITQIHVTPTYEIELIPALGHHIILLGDVNDLEAKLGRLFHFYKEGQQKIDWNRYNEIDLRFAGQIVARNTEVAELIDVTVEKYKEEEQLRLKQVAAQKAAKSKSKPSKPTLKSTKP